MSSAEQKKSAVLALTLAAVGVVYGDIGTSPLYAMKEVFAPEHGLPLHRANIFGAVSLIVWGLILVVSLKYVSLILRANNRGEGGVMSLTALALESVGKKSRLYFPLTLVGLAGASLFFGDGVVTPAISVLSAFEGLEVATPAFKPYVLPLTIVVLFVLYSLQSRGSSRIGRYFGPIMVIWFATLATMGVINIARNPEILGALNPVHAAHFFANNGVFGFLALGAVVLAFTGAEALYADMGHFGKRPIRLAWFCVTFPALALNYLGQGALLLADPSAVENPFYHQLGAWSIYPLVALSTVATVIASQATISGTFSAIQQAIALGFLPRMRVVYTSDREMGQIYIPLANWVQLAVVMGAVIGFGSSSAMAAAYGIATTVTMLATTILTFFVIRYRWKYPLILCIAATGFFFVMDSALLSANILKIVHGGWFSLLLGAVMMTIMLTWQGGRQLVYEGLQKHSIPLREFLDSLFISPPHRVEGTGIFFRAEGDGVPHALLHNLLHNKVLQERVIFLTVINVDIPYVPADERIQVEDMGNCCYQLDVRYGFKDERDIPAALALCEKYALPFNLMETSFFINRQTVVPTVGSGMAMWREGLFAAMSRNARDAADYFKVPTNRVIELGTQVEI